MRTMLALCALALSGCATNSQWSRDDTRAQLIFTAALAADAYSTAQIRNHPEVWESGPIPRAILGKNPDPESVIVSAIVGGLLHWYISRRLRPSVRPYWQYGFAFVHGKAAWQNCAHYVDC